MKVCETIRTYLSVSFIPDAGDLDLFSAHDRSRGSRGDKLGGSGGVVEGNCVVDGRQVVNCLSYGPQRRQWYRRRRERRSSPSSKVQVKFQRSAGGGNSWWRLALAD